MPEFTKCKPAKPYTDIICVGVSVESRKYQYSDNVSFENIHGFHTIHLKPKSGKCNIFGDPITWDCADIFNCIINFMPVASNTLIVTNHSLAVVGSSDFTRLLESDEICIHNLDKDLSDIVYEGQGKVSTECFIASGPPTILIFKHVLTGRTFTLVDIANYGPKYISDIWDNLNNEERDTIHNEAELGISTDNSLTCCCLVAIFMRKYYNIVSNHKLGGLSLTYSAQGMRAYRSQFYSGEIKLHDDRQARYLEDNCYLGGRVEAKYHGHYPDESYLIDLQSLYPHIGRIKKFPTELQAIESSPDKKTIEQWIQEGIVFAHCHVDSPLPAYPVKYQGRLTFPTGAYNAYLCADEFNDAWKEGRVKHVYKAQFYKCEFILASYSDFMLTLRTRYKGANDRLSEFITKCITNGLWGKLGQCGNCWVIDEEKQADRPYGGFNQFCPVDDRVYQYRIIDYIVSKLCYSPFSDNVSIPISACINSYSRHYLWRHMLQAGLRNILYCCVDGLIVTKEGFDRLAWLIAPNPYIYGMYKISEHGENCTILGYGQYSIGNKICSQGLPRKDGKHIRGFWSVLNDNNALHTLDVFSGKQVLASYSSSSLRQEKYKEHDGTGQIIYPEILSEQILPHTFESQCTQGHLWHEPEWSK